MTPSSGKCRHSRWQSGLCLEHCRFAAKPKACLCSGCCNFLDTRHAACFSTASFSRAKAWLCLSDMGAAVLDWTDQWETSAALWELLRSRGVGGRGGRGVSTRPSRAGSRRASRFCQAWSRRRSFGILLLGFQSETSAGILPCKVQLLCFFRSSLLVPGRGHCCVFVQHKARSWRTRLWPGCVFVHSVCPDGPGDGL